MPDLRFVAFLSRVISACVVTVAVLRTKSAFAQRADANAVTAAQDAFGVTINGQSLGLYDSRNIRNFDPFKLGNVRIDGLYFDRQGSFTTDLIESSAIKVGLNTIDYPFPAPSGIVDYHIRDYGKRDETSVTFGVGPFVSPYFGWDFAKQLSRDEIFVTGGVGVTPRETLPTGGYNHYDSVALNLILKRTPTMTVSAFWNQMWDRRIYPEPVIYLETDSLPLRPPRGVDLGQPWALGTGHSTNVGVRSQWLLAPSPWSSSVGLFYSEKALDEGFDQILSDIDTNGRGKSAVYGYRNALAVSLSGEGRLGYSKSYEGSSHTFTASVRGRRVLRRFGGEEVFDIGSADIFERHAVARPSSDFAAPQSREGILQGVAGLRYAARFEGLGLMTIGVQRSAYKKEFIPGLGLATSNQSTDTLLVGGIAVPLLSGLAIYADYAEGVEEGGTAPAEAVNRYQVLPIIKSSQFEAGVRYRTERIRVDLAAYDLRKPYAARDENSTYRFMGTVRNRGIEASMSASPFAALKIVTGLLFLQPRLSVAGSWDDEHALRPVGIPTRRAQVHVNYVLAFFHDMSFDARLSYTGGAAFSRSGLANVASPTMPDQTTVDLGLRYPFRAWITDCVVRFQVTNVLNEFSWIANTDGGLAYSPARTFNLALTTAL